MHNKVTIITGGFRFPTNHILLPAKITGTPSVKTSQISVENAPNVLTDNIQKGYSLNESVVRGET